MIKAIRNGAFTGVLIAGVFSVLIFLRPLPVSESIVFAVARTLCPLILLVFSSGFHGLGSALLFIAAANAVIYALLFLVVYAGLRLAR